METVPLNVLDSGASAAITAATRLCKRERSLKLVRPMSSNGNKELTAFAEKLEQATLDTIESGKMTKDLAMITSIPNPVVLNSEAFIKEIAEKLSQYSEK